MAHRDPSSGRSLVDWPTSVGIAFGGTVAAVGLMILFTELVDWIGPLWSQVVYFLAVFGAVVWLGARDRRQDSQDPSRLRRAASVTPAGLPGPFVATQAFGVLAVGMAIVGVVIGVPRGLIWIGGAWVLFLVGMVGLGFWLATLREERSRRNP